MAVIFDKYELFFEGMSVGSCEERGSLMVGGLGAEESKTKIGDVVLHWSYHGGVALLKIQGREIRWQDNGNQIVYKGCRVDVAKGGKALKFMRDGSLIVSFGAD